MKKDEYPLLPDLLEKTELYKENRTGAGNTGDPSVSMVSRQIPLHRRILLVEDNLVNQEVVVDMLEQPGLQIDICANGQEAVKVYRQHHYDLVLMDCEMPVMDGFTATQKIREYELQDRCQAVPIVALTAHALDGMSDKCFVSGMNDFLSKPFNLDSIRNIVEKWTNRKSDAAIENISTTDAAQHQPAFVENEVQADTIIDMQVIQRLRKSQRMNDKVGGGGQPSLVNRIIALFLQQTPAMLVQLAQAVSEKNVDRVVDVAHSLKSSCRAIGALSMAESCHKIESAGREGLLEASAMKRFYSEINYIYQQVNRVLNNILRSEN